VSLVAAPLAARRSVGSTVRAYVDLTKPRIILLLLITTVPAMILAERGMPSGWLILATLLGGTVSAGGANALNQYFDRDIDEVMARTRRRPMPSHRVAPQSALVFGVALGAGAFAFLAVAVNLLAASLSLGALLFYVFVYTLWLKRTTPQNIVIGGAAGAAPALVGWAAVTGRVDLPAVALFLVVFLWTPPHFWALSLKYRNDYAAAGVPMLPVVAGVTETTRQIAIYSVVLVATTLGMVPVAHLGPIYTVAAAVLGAWFIADAVRLRRTDGRPAVAMALFKHSISYLALLFAAVAVDTLVRFGA
jgi:protoheme IX farnesyltransferase